MQKSTEGDLGPGIGDWFKKAISDQLSTVSNQHNDCGQQFNGKIAGGENR